VALQLYNMLIFVAFAFKFQSKIKYKKKLIQE